MTIASTISRVDYRGDGFTTTFAVPFYFQNSADLVVSFQDADGNLSVGILGTHYTVTGAGLSAGGNITLPLPSNAGGLIAIVRQPQITQTTSYNNNDPFAAKSHELALDKLTTIDQSLSNQINRALMVAPTDVPPIATLPAAKVRALKNLSFDSLGNPIASAAPANGAISTAMQPFTAASSIAAAQTILGVSNEVATLAALAAVQASLNILQSGQTGGHVGFATNAAMQAAVGSYAAGIVADCFDPNPTLSGVFIRQVSASWGTAVSLLPAVAAANVETLLYNFPPSLGTVLSGAVVLIRLNLTDWIVRTPIVNGKPGEFTEWLMKDIGPAASPAQTHVFTMASISTNENGIRRIQSDYFQHGAVFEYAMNVGLMTDSLGLWGFYGNGHGHVTYVGASIQMDGGANLRDTPVGTCVFGTSLTFSQSFNIRLPKDDTTVIGNINQGHIFDVNGCLVSVTHAITAAGIGNQNSYSAMLPVSGCNMAKFGTSAAIAINTFTGLQTANQGKQTTIQCWHTDRPDLLVEMTLPTGFPGSPDNFTNVTTSDEFVIQNPTYSKCYINFRSGTTALAADASSSHSTQYRVRKP